MLRFLLPVLLLSVQTSLIKGQSRNDDAYVDKKGIIRSRSDNAEIYGFGVNYTLPFAHEYRMAIKTGQSPENFIREDVYHMARLDLDLYRVHVWDTEISDTLGNLIENEHLRLFDFAINEMKQRGIRFVITPIAFWGNGWPEEDEKTPGFSHLYGKAACLTNPAAIAAQANYLEQFLNHVNPYTGLSYKNDPSVIAFEISNEPHHNETSEKETAYINTMVKAMRKTGCGKPVFYNMSHSIHLAGAYMKANIQGGTFQWYPTGLVASHQINGNFLPHVSDYAIPFGDDPAFGKMAKIVYEFDPADASGNYMYPAMALTFRRTGMQLAAHFAYDAMCQAPFNTNYGTHFMNLAYAPQKAISLKIASAVFHHLPLEQMKGKTEAEPLTISYSDNLAVWNNDTQYFYSNSTGKPPKGIIGIKEIAGYGSSPVISYDGSGAYFLDKVSEGVWRLEVMPDAYWIDDPYGPVNPAKQKAAVMHNIRNMKVLLPDLGADFKASPLNAGNNHQALAEDGKIQVIPGVYLLKSNKAQGDYRATDSFKNIRLGEYTAPESNLAITLVHNYTPVEVSEGSPLIISFEVVSPENISSVEVLLSGTGRMNKIGAVNTAPGKYECEVPSDLIKRGFLSYTVVVNSHHRMITFPGALEGNPFGWENRHRSYYQVRVVPGQSQLILWDAASDWEHSYAAWDPGVRPLPGNEGNVSLVMESNSLPIEYSNNEQCYVLKYYFAGKIKGRYSELKKKRFLVIKLKNFTEHEQAIEAGLVDQNAVVAASEVLVNNKENMYKIPLEALTTGDFLIVPRPYPEFLPLKAERSAKDFDISAAEMIQLVIKVPKGNKVHLEIEKIWLE